MSFGWSAPSEEDLASGKNLEYDVLPEDEYIARVTSIELKKDQPNNFPSKNDPDPTHDMLVLKAEALTFADGEPLVDVDDEPIEGSVPFQVWLNPKKVGMIPQPSKTRKAFAAILGQPIGRNIDIGSFDELIGKTFIVSLKPNGTFNNAQDFRAVKMNRTRGTTVKGPVSADDLAQRATEIFDEDAPSNVSPVETTPTVNEAPKRGRKAAAAPVVDSDDLEF